MTCRLATRGEVALILDWAAAEGWNPGLDDTAACHAADPAGFLVAERNGAPVVAVSVVNHSADVAFLGLYLCKARVARSGCGVSAVAARPCPCRGAVGRAGRGCGATGQLCQIRICPHRGHAALAGAVGSKGRRRRAPGHVRRRSRDCRAGPCRRRGCATGVSGGMAGRVSHLAQRRLGRRRCGGGLCHAAALP